MREISTLWSATTWFVKFEIAGLLATPLLLQLLGHHECPRVVAEHEPEEEHVETASGCGFEPGELGGGEHPRQVRRVIVLTVVRRILSARFEPALHLADLVPLGDLEPS